MLRPSAWKDDSANFAKTEFSDVRSKGRAHPVSSIRPPEEWLWGLRVDTSPKTQYCLSYAPTLCWEMVPVKDASSGR